ncbi:MAG: hypothetical protein JW915_15240 [Chitinispirillaceae bacterium]|nr:hypothetical protein [Chitinispirillaceae bacterium]
MRILKPVILSAVLCLFAVSCGTKQPKIKKGDKLVVQEELPRETAETQWEDDYTDGFTAVIPKGTVLEVLFSPKMGAAIVECLPVEIGEKKDPEAIEEFIVPESIRTKEGYKSYSFSIKMEYIGSKVTLMK